MGVRVRVHDGETIGEALRRLKKLLISTGQSWELFTRGRFVPANKYRWNKKLRKRLKARRQTLLAQQAGEQPVYR